MQNQTLWQQLQQIPREDWSQYIKKNHQDLWLDIAWSKVNLWRGNQQKQSSVLGDTPDYNRTLFTLDDRATKMVNFAFKKYWEDGLLYKGSYLVNWSVGLQTAVSDVAGEIEYEKRVDPFITFEYKVYQGHVGNMLEAFCDANSIDYTKLDLCLSNFSLEIRVSTVRPETMFGDVAIAVHPLVFKKDLSSKVLQPTFTEDEALRIADLIVERMIKDRYMIYFHVTNTLTNQSIQIIIDTVVDPNFGTGYLKVTPASDITDYEIYKRHRQQIRLPIPHSIGRNGKLTEVCGENYKGLTVEQGRLAVIKKLVEDGYIPMKNLDSEGRIITNQQKIEKLAKVATNLKSQSFNPANYSYTEGQKKLQEMMGDDGKSLEIDWNYEHNVTICERTKTVIEPLISEEFFLSYHREINTQPSVDPLVRRGNVENKTTLQSIGLQVIQETTFYPAEIKDRAINFLENIKDWCVSRDMIWGHKIPVWYNLDLNPNKVFYSYKDWQNDEKVRASFQISPEKPTLSGDWVQEEKILDTWFSSCLWPLSTLDYVDYANGKLNTDFDTFYPTTDMVTGVDILYTWIIRMSMLGKYFTGKIPYKNVIITPTVRDEQGRKMSKSLGNGLDPVAQIDKYSSDSLRLAMLSGMIPARNFRLGGKIADKMSEKYRNFGNKLWNVARFLEGR